MNFMSLHQLESVDIARTKLQVSVVRLAVFDQQNGLVNLQGVERLAEFLGLRLFQFEGVHDHQLAFVEFRSQRRTQRSQQLLAGEGVVIGTRLWSVHRAAVPPQRRTDRAYAGAPRALLLPQFLARTRYQLAVLGGMRTGAQRGTIVLDRFPEQVFVDRAEYFVGQVQRAYLVAAQIVNINRCHNVSF